MQLILGLSLGLIFFLCTIYAYTTGLKHGKQLSNNNIPQLNINPVKAYKEHKEEKEVKKEVDKYTQGWQNILAYTGDPQKEVSN